jgi:hypothetical protein
MLSVEASVTISEVSTVAMCVDGDVTFFECYFQQVVYVKTVGMTFSTGDRALNVVWSGRIGASH